MLTATKLQVSNVVMTPNLLLDLQHLEDYCYKKVARIPMNDEEWPDPNSFRKDVFNFETLQLVTADNHRLSDTLRGCMSQQMLVQNPESETMLPLTNLVMSNIVMTPLNLLLILQNLTDYYYDKAERLFRTDEEWPVPNLFREDYFN